MRKLIMALIMSLPVTVFFSPTVNAAPLPNGTILKIAPGNAGGGLGALTACTMGSCIGWYIGDPVAPGQEPFIWTNILPGTDGGFIIGKSQVSGGQEIVYTSTATGELTAAAPMWGSGPNPATLYTMPDGGLVNVFDDASCAKDDCLGDNAKNFKYSHE